MSSQTLGRSLHQATCQPGVDTVAARVIEADSMELLRRLVRRVTCGPIEAGERPTSGSSRPGTILDVEVDGVRCMLVRTPHPEPVSSGASLSPREIEIVRMVTKGLPTKAIADVLEISPWTVCTHLRRIYSKLDVRSRAAMVMRVVERRLLPQVD